MKSYIFSIISAVLFVAEVSAQLTLNTPVGVLSCTALQVTWTGGTAPYTLSVHPGATPNDNALATFTNLTGTSFLWPSVNFAPNTQLDLTLRDSSGLVSQTAPFTVQTGPLTCLNGTNTPSDTTVAVTTGTVPAATSAGATTGTNPTSAQSKAASGSASGSSSSKASTPTSSGNAAMSTSISYGAAGVLGAVIAAVFI